MTRTVKVGMIGCGLMGREFASAAARWCHLPDSPVRPELIAICKSTRNGTQWFTSHFPAIRQVTTDYRELLANPEVEVVYVAVPHHLHEEIYCAAIRAGKHMMGEKPFGIDMRANQAILDCLASAPDLFVRCSSEFPFYPAVQAIGRMMEEDAFGTILEAGGGLLHSSDLDPQKPINWKRMIDFNGEYGCMGDLGMHVCHMPLRAGWRLLNVRAILSNIVTERSDGKGAKVPCRTWDNATLLCEATCGGFPFPLTLKTQRIAPGNRNTWYFEIMGTRACARYSTQDPNALHLLEYRGGSQSWQRVEMGHQVVFPSITGGIFEVGFPDIMLQMWGAFFHEMEHGQPRSRFAACVTPAETGEHHRLLTAALQSQATGGTVSLS